MRKVQLNLSQVPDDPYELFNVFVRTAREQGFSKEYVEMVFERALLSSYKNLNQLVRDHIELNY